MRLLLQKRSILTISEKSKTAYFDFVAWGDSELHRAKNSITQPHALLPQGVQAQCSRVLNVLNAKLI